MSYWSAMSFSSCLTQPPPKPKGLLDVQGEARTRRHVSTQQHRISSRALPGGGSGHASPLEMCCLGGLSDEGEGCVLSKHPA